MTLPPEIAELARALRPLRMPWGIAGGWALDLALGRVTRPHADVDVAVFREDQAGLRAALPGWAFHAVVGGVTVPWGADERLDPPVHEVHARPGGGRSGPALEFLLNEREGADWVYRRDAGVRRPLARAFRAVGRGLVALAPELVLLYKSKAPRAVDEADFAVWRGRLDADAREWLRAALSRADPAHPWAAALMADA